MLLIILFKILYKLIKKYSEKEEKEKDEEKDKEKDEEKNISRKRKLTPEMKKIVSNFAITIFKDIHLAFFFVEIGLSCIRYLSSGYTFNYIRY